jgi:hypothetical protein
MSAPDVRICGAPTRSGKRCGQVLGDSDRECIWHGASVTAEDRLAIARRGGLTHLRVLAAETPQADVFYPVKGRRRPAAVRWSCSLRLEGGSRGSPTTRGRTDLGVHRASRKANPRVTRRCLNQAWRLPDMSRK